MQYKPKHPKPPNKNYQQTREKLHKNCGKPDPKYWKPGRKHTPLSRLLRNALLIFPTRDILKRDAQTLNLERCQAARLSPVMPGSQPMPVGAFFLAPDALGWQREARRMAMSGEKRLAGAVVVLAERSGGQYYYRTRQRGPRQAMSLAVAHYTFCRLQCG